MANGTFLVRDPLTQNKYPIVVVDNGDGTYALQTGVAAVGGIGSLTETAPTTDTASSGLNGRLQRIAQRITSLIALLPTALGAGGGLKVDGSGTALPVSGSVTADTELPAASALNGTIAKSVSAPVVGAGLLVNDGTNLVQAKAGAQGGVVIEGVASGTAVPVSGTFYQTTQPTSESPVACASADVHAPAVNTAAVVTYAATASVKHCITGIAWSYIGGIPTGGNLKVEDVSGTTVFTIDIDESGPGVITFPKPKKSAAVNTAMIITLAAGGAGVTGKVSVLDHWTEA